MEIWYQHFLPNISPLLLPYSNIFLFLQIMDICSYWLFHYIIDLAWMIVFHITDVWIYYIKKTGAYYLKSVQIHGQDIAQILDYYLTCLATSFKPNWNWFITIFQFHIYQILGNISQIFSLYLHKIVSKKHISILYNLYGSWKFDMNQKNTEQIIY